MPPRKDRRGAPVGNRRAAKHGEETHKTFVRLPASIRATLEHRAQQQGRTISEVIVTALRASTLPKSERALAADLVEQGIETGRFAIDRVRLVCELARQSGQSD